MSKLEAIADKKRNRPDFYIEFFYRMAEISVGKED